MKLIESSAEYIPQEEGLEGVYKQIEKAARVCYKSEAKCDGTYESAKKFVDKLIERGHTAMLEHGVVYLKTNLPDDEITPIKSLYHYARNQYSKYIVTDRTAYITTNLRVVIENDWENDLEYICKPTEYHEKRYTFKLITSIGIVRELLRHRVFSFANESTRYCNYSADKFDNELVFITPYWAPNYDETCWDYFLSFLYKTEKEYIKMTESRRSPQQAREVLPLCTKSEIVMTGFESDWKYFLDLRLKGVTGEPHPDMKILAEKIRVELLKAEFDYNKIKE